MKIYLAGPMRGYKDFNFPAFDAAKEVLESCGHVVHSPADLDREIGFDETKNSLEGFSIEDAARRDLEAIIDADAVVLIGGWEKSRGATAERHIAYWIDRQVFELVGDELHPLEFRTCSASCS